MLLAGQQGIGYVFISEIHQDMHLVIMANLLVTFNPGSPAELIIQIMFLCKKAKENDMARL